MSTGPVPDRSRTLARFLDDAVTIPGTRIGVGADALLGLVPGVGDLAGSAMSGIIVLDAVRCRVPVPVLARMGWNLLLDAVLGVVPGVGDLLDVAHRANRKNLRLLEEHAPAGGASVGPGYFVAAALLLLLPLLVGVALGIVALVLLVRLLT